MSDEDDFGVKEDDEVSIPRAALNKFIKDVLPDARLSNDTRDLLLRCCHAFIHQIATHANEACLAANRKTISPQHVFDALDAMQLSAYKEHAEAASAEAKEELKGRRMLSAAYRFKHQNSDDLERLAKEQQEFFLQARADFDQEQLELAASGLAGRSNGSDLLVAAASEHHEQLRQLHAASNAPGLLPSPTPPKKPFELASSSSDSNPQTDSNYSLATTNGHLDNNSHSDIQQASSSSSIQPQSIPRVTVDEDDDDDNYD